MDASTTESLLPLTATNDDVSRSDIPENRKSSRKSVRIDETVDIITANSSSVLESTPLQAVETKRSLESRDNPFVPGGELSIDTDDILKRATIVRDKFILEEEEKKKAAEEQSMLIQSNTDGPPAKDVAKSPELKGSEKGIPKENGKVEDLLTPETVKGDELASHTPSEGQNLDSQEAPKEKKKQKKKCCTIM